MCAQGIGFTYPWILDDLSFGTYLAGLFPGASLATLSSVSTAIYPLARSVSDLPYNDDLDRAALMTSEVLVTCNNYLLALAYRNATYNYLFDIFPGLHGDDLHYTFGPDSPTKSPEVQLAMQSYIGHFSQTGDPNGNGQPPFRGMEVTVRFYALALVDLRVYWIPQHQNAASYCKIET